MYMSGCTLSSESRAPLRVKKGQVRPRRGHKSPEGVQKYSSTLFLTSALDGGGWLAPRSDRFNPGKKTRYPLYRRLCGPQGRSERVRNI